MAVPSIFICHTQPNAAFARDLALALESCRLNVWHDSRNLRGGDRLVPEIRWAIEQARQVIVILGANTGEPAWLRREIEIAQEVERRRADSYQVIPLLLPGTDSTILGRWFIPAPRCAPIAVAPDGLGSILPTLLAILGKSPPSDPPSNIIPLPIAALEFNFSHDHSLPGHWRWIVQLKRRLDPKLTTAIEQSGQALPVPPLKNLQTWYLKHVDYWPNDTVAEVARRVEKVFIEWGTALQKALFKHSNSQGLMEAWYDLAHSHERQLVICSKETAPLAGSVLGFPWELLHESTGFLVQGQRPVQVWRQLPGGGQPFLPTPPPLRILMLSPRPDTEPTGHFDHRRSTLPLVEALGTLGGLVEAHPLSSPTLTTLEQRLNDAAANGRPFMALHLDAYLRKDADNSQILVGFEALYSLPNTLCRDADFISAAALGSILATYHVRLISLSCHANAACDFALTVDLTRMLLAAGVAAVITLHPDTPAETQRRFWSGFYQELLHGTRISRAMLAGQRRLTSDSYRAPGLGGNMHLMDWFCCQLYRGEHDPRFCIRPPLELWRRLLKSAWNSPPSRLPPLPTTGFIGRSRTLLIMERLIEEQRTLFLRGPNGNGKTTTAIAFAHWLLRCGRFQQVAYVNHDDAREPNLLLEALGRQLLPDGKRWSIERYSNFWEALRHLHQSLIGQSVLIVLDQLEHWPSACDEIFQQLWSELLRQIPELRLLGLGRLGPPTFARPWKEVTLGAIDEEDGIRLICQTLIAARELPPTTDSGNGFQPLRDLVKLAGGHPAALQRVASEIAARGVNATLALLRPLRAEVLSRHANDAQWPLFLSLELAIRRLTAEDQEHLMILAFFKEGVNSIALGKALLLDVQQLEGFIKRLLALELIQDRGYGHLRFDPALSQHLTAQLSVSERLLWRERWCNGMEALVEALYQQYFKDKARTTHLLRLELPNLMALLRDHQQHFSAERNARLASRLEQLTANLGVQSALSEIIAARERSSKALSGWSRMRFEIERLRVERLRENGLIEDAFQAARHLLRQSQEAGIDSYHGADYDLGRAHFQLAKLLKLAGAAQSAINEFTTARQRFQALAATGNRSANRMIAVTDAEMGDCFLYLQRLAEAATAYEAAIAHTGPKTFDPVVATNMLQLGVVRQRQGQYSQALALYDGARRMFEGLGDPEGAARAWQQLALAHKLSGEPNSALHASQQALYLYEQRRHRDGIAEILTELGHLYQVLEQLELAAAAYRRLAELCAEAGDSLGEEASRNKLANILLQLQRPDEARQELYRASTCNLPDSYTARNWAIRRGLHDFGQMVQNPDIADRARRQAMQKYLAYRKTGGDNDNAGARLCMQVRQAIHTGDIESLSHKLEQLAMNPNIPDIGKLLIAKLQEILAGSRDPSLVADPALHYQYAVELQLLLEDLASR